jgi:hypothetical protein
MTDGKNQKRRKQRLNDFVYLRLRGNNRKKAPGLTPHPKASPAPSNKASNFKANFIVQFIRNCLVLQE